MSNDFVSHWVSPLGTVQRIEGYDRLLFQWWWIGLPLAALMILLALWRCCVLMLQWWRKPRLNPIRLYQQLLRIHQLNRSERQQIKELSKRLPMHVQASILFVDPSSWAWPEANAASAIESFEKLFLKIFGFPPDRIQAK
jgi:hypothetical protein